MANIERSNIGKLHDKISVIVTKEDYMPAFEKTLKNYSKNANIPGFRKGFVPTGMIKKMYGQSVFNDEVIKTAFSEVDKYINTEKPDIFAQPMSIINKDLKIDYNNPQEYVFDFEIGLKPDFTIKPLEQKSELTKYVIKVSDEMVGKEIEQLRMRAGKLEDKETQTDDADLISLSYFPLDGEGKRMADAKPEEDVLDYNRQPAELKTLLKGAKTNATFTFNPNSILDENEKADFIKNVLKSNNEDVANEYEILVTKIAQVNPRELNEEFYKEVFPSANIKDESEFREEIKKILSIQMERYTLEKLHNDIFETLVHDTEIELPEQFLRRWLKEGGEQLKSDEEVAKEWPKFDHQIRWTLISDKLVNKYNIKVTADEIRDDIKERVMSYFGIQNEDEASWMQSYLDKMLKDRNTIEETHNKLIVDKLFGAVVNDLNIKEQQVTEEEFSQIPNQHHHHHDH